jgi:hypothetical protein
MKIIKLTDSTIKCWYSKHHLKDTGYDDGQIIKGKDVLSTINNLFNKGLNVMLMHGANGNIIFVDTERFSCR